MVFLSHDSQVGVPKSYKLGLLWLWSTITLRAKLGLKCTMKQSCNVHQELSNGMSHTVFRQVNRVDSWLFWLEVKLAVWLPTLLLTITCVLDIQMSNAISFQTSTFQELSNDIKHSNINAKIKYEHNITEYMSKPTETNNRTRFLLHLDLYFDLYSTYNYRNPHGLILDSLIKAWLGDLSGVALNRLNYPSLWIWLKFRGLEPLGDLMERGKKQK